MNLAWLAVATAAVCSGSAAVAQASAVRKLPTTATVNTGFAIRLVRSPRYLLALVLIAVGFGLSIVALRTLPLFVVQAGRASSLGVTALLSVLVLGVRLRLAEACALVGIGAGMVVIAFTAGPRAVAEIGLAARLGLLAGVAMVSLVAGVVLRRQTARAGLVLALLAGACFGLLALAARVLRSFDPTEVLTDPAAWAGAIAGVLGLLLGALALQRASVVTVTSAMVATETVFGSVLGMVVCGDRPESGMAVPAAAGFLTVLGGALLLARFGAPAPDDDGREETAVLPIG